MQARFAIFRRARNTVVIAQRCNLTLALDTYYLPEYPIPEGETLRATFAASAGRASRRAWPGCPSF